MMNDNDLIRRGDAILAIKQAENFKLNYWNNDVMTVDAAINAINAIPAVSGEPVGYVSSIPINKIAASIREDKNLAFQFAVYATPQDQSARIAELEAQLARYECVAWLINDPLHLNGITKDKQQGAYYEARGAATNLFALKDEK